MSAPERKRRVAGSDFEFIQEEPTREEVENYARFLGLDPVVDPDLMWIAREGLTAPLPQGWKPCQTPGGELYYYNSQTGASAWCHPLDTHYKNKAVEEKSKKDAGMPSSRTTAYRASRSAARRSPARTPLRNPPNVLSSRPEPRFSPVIVRSPPRASSDSAATAAAAAATVTEPPPRTRSSTDRPPRRRAAAHGPPHPPPSTSPPPSASQGRPRPRPHPRFRTRQSHPLPSGTAPSHDDIPASAALRAELRKLKSQKGDLEHTLTALETRKAKTIQTLDASAAQIDDLQSRLRDERQRHETGVEELRRQKTVLGSEVEELVSRCRGLRREAGDLVRGRTGLIVVRKQLRSVGTLLRGVRGMLGEEGLVGILRDGFAALCEALGEKERNLHRVVQTEAQTAANSARSSTRKEMQDLRSRELEAMSKSHEVELRSLRAKLESEFAHNLDSQRRAMEEDHEDQVATLKAEIASQVRSGESKVRAELEELHLREIEVSRLTLEGTHREEMSALRESEKLRCSEAVRNARSVLKKELESRHYEEMVRVRAELEEARREAVRLGEEKGELEVSLKEQQQQQEQKLRELREEQQRLQLQREQQQRDQQRDAHAQAEEEKKEEEGPAAPSPSPPPSSTEPDTQLLKKKLHRAVRMVNGLREMVRERDQELERLREERNGHLIRIGVLEERLQDLQEYRARREALDDISDDEAKTKSRRQSSGAAAADDRNRSRRRDDLVEEMIAEDDFAGEEPPSRILPPEPTFDVRSEPLPPSSATAGRGTGSESTPEYDDDDDDDDDMAAVREIPEEEEDIDVDGGNVFSRHEHYSTFQKQALAQLQGEEEKLLRATEYVRREKRAILERRQKLIDARREWKSDFRSTKRPSEAYAVLSGVKRNLDAKARQINENTKQVNRIQRYVGLRREKIKILRDRVLSLSTELAVDDCGQLQEDGIALVGEGEEVPVSFMPGGDGDDGSGSGDISCGEMSSFESLEEIEPTTQDMRMSRAVTKNCEVVETLNRIEKEICALNDNLVNLKRSSPEDDVDGGVRMPDFADAVEAVDPPPPRRRSHDRFEQDFGAGAVPRRRNGPGRMDPMSSKWSFYFDRWDEDYARRLTDFRLRMSKWNEGREIERQILDSHCAWLKRFQREIEKSKFRRQGDSRRRPRRSRRGVL